MTSTPKTIQIFLPSGEPRRMDTFLTQSCTL